jgi:hypothetical protein
MLSARPSSSCALTWRSRPPTPVADANIGSWFERTVDVATTNRVWYVLVATGKSVAFPGARAPMSAAGDDLHELCAHLDALERCRPNRLAREHVNAALHSKWEGVQVHAGRALAAWGDRDSVASLRAWLRTCLEKANGWCVTGEAVACLVRCCTPEDADWILNEYFDCPDQLTRHWLLPLLDTIDARTLSGRIQRESTDQNSPRFEAARIAARRLAHRTGRT